MNELIKDPLIVVLFVLIILSGIVFRSGKRTRRRNYRRQPKQGQHFEEQLTEFPYQLQRDFLTAAELNFLQSLRSVVGSKAAICTKVRLGDVFVVNIEDSSKFVGYNNKINRKHIDFLLCDSATMQPIVGLELDDRSHQREDRRERDAFVDQVFGAAKLPLLHVTAKRTYAAAELTAQLAPYLDRVSLSVTSPPAVNMVSALQQPTPVLKISPQATGKIPHCPECGRDMVLRTVKKGTRVGTKFWGCTNYPQCQGMIALRE